MKKLLLAFLLFCSFPVLAERILVFPFAQKGDDIKTLWLEMGVSASIEESLVHSGVLCVPIDDLENYFEEQGLVSQPRFPLSARLGLARHFGASHLLTGSYSIENGALSIEMTAYSLERSVKKEGVFSRSGRVEELRQLTGELSKSFLEGTGKRFEAYPAVNPEAFESYIRGRIAMDPTLREVYFRKAVEISPEYYDAHCLLALTLRDEDKTTECVRILEELKRKSYSRSSLGLRSLGELKMEAGKLTEAKELFTASLKGAENAEGHILLSRLYLKQGKKEEALKEARVAESFGTHSEEAAALMEEINPEQ